MKYKYNEIIGIIDHSILSPTIADHEIILEATSMAHAKVASVCMKPYTLPALKPIMDCYPSVKLGCVVGFPHGNSSIPVKIFETEQAIKDGAREIDAVVNIGKIISREWSYVYDEISLICAMAHTHGVKVKIILEMEYLPLELKVGVCETAIRAGADWIKTCTGYGYIKQNNGDYNYHGATDGDIKLMVNVCAGTGTKVKASGKIRTLADVIRMKELGVDRCGSSNTLAIISEYINTVDALGEIYY
jgi:deoxyribose-phosphate aldolase